MQNDKQATCPGCDPAPATPKTAVIGSSWTGLISVSILPFAASLPDMLNVSFQPTLDAWLKQQISDLCDITKGRFLGANVSEGTV